MTDGKDMRDALNTAIADVIQHQEHGFVTKWIALVESVDEDGVRGLWMCGHEDLKRWDSIGMLHYALTLDSARAARDDESGEA